jgi:hypothetical protein
MNATIREPLAMIMMVVALALIVLPSAHGYAEFDNKPFPDFTLTQNTTFVFDFNATFTGNGTPVPEIGSTIRYDFSSADKENFISPTSTFTFSTITGLLTYNPSNDDATKNFTILFLLREPGEDGAVLDAITPRFSIANINDPPEILNAEPASPISASENDSIILNVTALDIDAPYEENLTIHWNIYRPDENGTFENPILANTTSEDIDPFGDMSERNYTIGFCDAPKILIAEADALAEGLKKGDVLERYQALRAKVTKR